MARRPDRHRQGPGGNRPQRSPDEPARPEPLLPHDLDAEQAVLGAALRDPDTLTELLPIVGADDFYKPAHGHIWDAATHLHSHGQPVDALTVGHHLRNLDLYDTIGGGGTLVDLVAAGPSTASAKQYAELVRRDARRRRVIVAARELARRELDGEDASGQYAELHDAWTATTSSRGLQRLLLGDAIRNGVPEPDKVHDWLYAGGLHVLQSEPGVGKSWVALWLCVQMMETGWSVLYLDEEGGQRLTAERLTALGVDPDLLDQRFHYYPFPQRQWTADDVAALRQAIDQAESPVGLGVLDSLPDFLAVAGLNEDKSMDVTLFVHKVLGPFRDTGAALLVLDHLTKPEAGKITSTRSRYSRGSGAKLGKAHLTLLLETVTEFDRDRSGTLQMWSTKDRVGASGLPHLGDPALLLDVAVDKSKATIDISIGSGGARESEWAGPTKCMDAVVDLLGTVAPNELSQRKVEEMVTGYRKTVVRDALRILHSQQRVRMRQHGQSFMYALLPVRETTQEDF